MLCTRHEMSCTFNPNLSWIHHHTEEKLFEFVLERRHATAVQQRWMLLDDVSIFMDWATHSTGTGGKFWIKGAIDELVQVWHLLLLLLYGGGERQIYYLVSILPMQWSVLSRFELLLRLTYLNSFFFSNIYMASSGISSFNLVAVALIIARKREF